MIKLVGKTSILIFCLLIVFNITSALKQKTTNKSKNDKTDLDSIFDKSIFGKAQHVKCDNTSVTKLDSFAHKLVNSRFPLNARELRGFCNAGIKSAGFILGFIKYCLTDFTKKAIQVVFHPVTNEIGIICRSGRLSKKAKEIIKAGRCGNAARPGLKRCYESFIDKQLAIRNATDKKRMIAMLCCQFNVLRECFKSEAEEVKQCTKRTIDFVERYALELFGEILNLMCYEYQDSSDRCNRVLGEIPVLDLDGIKKPRSFIPPMLDILQEIGDNF